MTDYIMIEGDLVTRYTKTIVSQTDLATVMQALTTRLPITLMNVPDKLKHLSLTPDSTRTTASLVIEHKPVARPVYFHRGRAHSSRPAKPFTVALPWTYYIFKAETLDSTLDKSWRIADWKVYWSQHRADNGTQALYYPLLPNMLSYGQPCMGNVSRTIPDGSLATVINATITAFTNGTANEDLRAFLPYSTFPLWVTATKTDPMCWTGWDIWNNPGPTTLAQAMEYHGFTTHNEPITIEGGIPEIPIPPVWADITNWLSTAPEGTIDRISEYLGNAHEYRISAR